MKTQNLSAQPWLQEPCARVFLVVLLQPTPYITAYAPNLTAYALNLIAYAPNLTAYAPNLTACSPNSTAYAPNLTAYASNLTAYAPLPRGQAACARVFWNFLPQLDARLESAATDCRHNPHADGGARNLHKTNESTLTAELHDEI
eukprot:6195893-Pleurochrysis_carterae.AAC.2